MKSIKRIPVLVALLMATVIFTACGGQEETQESKTEVEQTSANTVSKNDDQETSDETQIENKTDTSCAETTPTPSEYTIDSFENLNEGILVYKGHNEQGTGFGYINSGGIVIVPPIYEEASPFYNGMARVMSNGKYGYIGTDGSIILPCVYDYASEVFNTLSWVTVTNNGTSSSHYINTKGEIVYTQTGKEVKVSEFVNGFFWVETKEELISGDVHTMIYYDKTGKACFTLENTKNAGKDFNWSCFDDLGLAVVTTTTPEGIWGNWLINTDGELVQLQGFDECLGSSSNRNLYIEERNQNYMTFHYAMSGSDTLYVDFNTMTVYDTSTHISEVNYTGFDEFYMIDRFHYKYYWKTLFHGNDLDLNPNAVIDLTSIEAFGGASVVAFSYYENDGQNLLILSLLSSSEVPFTAIMDFEGNIVVAPFKAKTHYYDKGYASYIFHADLCKAQDTETNLFGFIDLEGNWVIQPQYEAESVTDFSGEGDNAIAVVNGNTIINRKGEVVFSIANNE